MLVLHTITVLGIFLGSEEILVFWVPLVILSKVDILLAMDCLVIMK